MGCAFELGLLETDAVQAEELLDLGIREIKRIELLFSEYLSDSVTTTINRYAGVRPLQVSDEVFGLIERALRISTITKGFFNPTVAPLKKLYRFVNTEENMPSPMQIRETLGKCNYNKVLLCNVDSSVFLAERGMQLSFNAIAKGYAADTVKRLWKNHGVTSGYINASGDLSAFGRNAKNALWSIGIADPDDPGKMLFRVPLMDAAVATSGDYEQHFTHDNKRYSHNINPITGLPVSGLKSVTVFSPCAELSDALATGLSAMGVNRGLNFVNQLPHTHAIFINSLNEVYLSKNLCYEATA